MKLRTRKSIDEALALADSLNPGPAPALNEEAVEHMLKVGIVIDADECELGPLSPFFEGREDITALTEEMAQVVGSGSLATGWAVMVRAGLMAMAANAIWHDRVWTPFTITGPNGETLDVGAVGFGDNVAPVVMLGQAPNGVPLEEAIASGRHLVDAASIGFAEIATRMTEEALSEHAWRKASRKQLGCTFATGNGAGSLLGLHKQTHPSPKGVH